MGNSISGMNVRSINVKFGGQTQLQGQVLLPETSRPAPGAILCHGLGSGQGALKPSGLSLAREYKSIDSLTKSEWPPKTFCALPGRQANSVPGYNGTLRESS